ncbi:MAG: acyltransferase family protein [Actinomycetaceae bacterium]|nr:acyltransferase family protein [Actinomycetaceae bacterium]
MFSKASAVTKVTANSATTQTTPQQPSRRIRGLDGVRALAAGAVLCYHLLPNYVPGGFLGVDVFFVLSGFLITALLIKESSQTGRINLKRFWLRRIRRLLPAVTLNAVVTPLVAAAVNFDLLARIRIQFLGVVTFSYNWVEILRGSSYFDHANPLLWTNVWSLAVEQQFYLIWPLVLLLILKLKPNWQWLPPVILAVASSLWMTYLVYGAEDFTRAYQGTDSHAFGLMLGAAAAIAAPHALRYDGPRSLWITAFLRGIVAWAGLVVLFLTWFLLPDNRAWMYPWGTWIACLAMLALIQGMLPAVDRKGGPGKWLANLLDSNWLRWLGERSYGIYLWHWPVWVIVTQQAPQLNRWLVALIVVSLSVSAAALSYKYVETPMRRDGITRTIRHWFGIKPGQFTPRQLPAWGRVTLASTACLCLLTSVGGVLVHAPEKTSAEQIVEAGQKTLATTNSSSSNANAQPSAQVSTIPSPTPSPTPTETDVFDLPITGQNVTVIGDSVTVASSPALSALLSGIDIDAAVSRSIVAGRQILETKTQDNTCRPYVVISLATNSYIEQEDLDAVLEMIGPDRRLVLVTGFGPQIDDWIFYSNNSIHAFAEAHPEQVQVADWAAAIEAHPEHLSSDYVHPTSEGGEIMAELVKATLDKFPQIAADKNRPKLAVPISYE